MRYVIDASIAFKWLLPEEGSEKALTLLRDGAQLYAPDLIYAEVANGLWMRVKSGECDIAEVDRRLERFARAPIEVVFMKPLLAQAFMIGAMINHKALYDCFYLALAVSLKEALLTADEHFARKIKTTMFKPYIQTLADLPS